MASNEKTTASAAPDMDPNAPQPRFTALGQYLKDLSVENPNAPASLKPGKTPTIDININVNAQKGEGTEGDFEVELKLDCKAQAESMLVFQVELVYAGVFRLENIPEDQTQPFVLIEAPRFLFPFAREIIANATRQAGFPPLMIDPVDFLALYRSRVAAEGGQQPDA